MQNRHSVNNEEDMKRIGRKTLDRVEVIQRVREKYH